VILFRTLGALAWALGYLVMTWIEVAAYSVMILARVFGRGPLANGRP
jgi:hypothetical protein